MLQPQRSCASPSCACREEPGPPLRPPLTPPEHEVGDGGPELGGRHRAVHHAGAAAAQRLQCGGWVWKGSARAPSRARLPIPHLRTAPPAPASLCRLRPRTRAQRTRPRRLCVAERRGALWAVRRRAARAHDVRSASLPVLHPRPSPSPVISFMRATTSSLLLTMTSSGGGRGGQAKGVASRGLPRWPALPSTLTHNPCHSTHPPPAP
jgi:hypothetical protein